MTKLGPEYGQIRLFRSRFIISPTGSEIKYHELLHRTGDPDHRYHRGEDTNSGWILIRPGITTKLFLTLSATIFVVIGVLLWWVNWSFDRGFIRYVNGEEERRAEIVASFLEDQYSLTVFGSLFAARIAICARLLAN